MKKICCLLLIVWGLVACGGGAGDSGGGDSSGAIRTLQQDETASGTISELGEVDWYEFNAVEANRTLTVSCTDTYGDGTPLPIDFMMIIHEEDAEGNMVPVFGESAADNTGGDIHINVGINRPRRLFFSVRDFMADESSDLVQYRIRASYSDETTDNETFADAINMAVGAAQVCHTDEAINSVGDIDVFQFNVASSGVYRISAEFAVSDMDVLPGNLNLGLELYTDSGELVYQFKGQRPGDGVYAVPAHLVAGTYYMIVDDQGRDAHSDYTYNLCVAPVSTDELLQDDTVANAVSVNDDLIEASLEYFQDEDWYAVTVPASAGTTSSNIRINLHNNFDTMTAELQRQLAGYSYRVEIRDAAATLLHAYDHPAAATASYIVEIASGQAGAHHIMVKPVFDTQMTMALPYQLRIELEEVSDPWEAQDPRTLSETGEVVNGKISRLGDVDAYSISVDTTTTPKVLEVAFETGEASEVAYNLHVMWDDEHHVLKDINGTQDGTKFKSSYYLPVPDTVNKITNVTMQVSDDQNNDGADVQYTLTVNVLDIPGAAAATAAETALDGGAAGAVYFNETAEQTATTNTVEVTVIEYDYHYQPIFDANTSLLRVGTLAGNQWTSPMITGYADYDGDRDIFELNFDDVKPTDGSDWYFDIAIKMFAIDSDVEYSWALFRDRPVDDGLDPNNILLERPFWEDTDGQILQYDEDAEGVIAFWGDDSLAAKPNYESTVPTGDQELWVGHRWDESNFYISIQDFNIALLEKVWNDTTERFDAVPNQTPDNDWGNSTQGVRPYYFQVTVTLHPGCSSPDECP